MKKAVIINNWPHQFSGGIESYSSELIKIFQELGFEVFEYSTLSIKNQKAISVPIKGVKQFDISNGAKFYRKTATKKINELIENNDFEIMISNSLLTKKGFYSNKVVTVQHMDHKFYEASSPQRWFDILNSIFFRIGYFKNSLKSVNTIFTTEYENVYKNENSFYILNPLRNDFKYPSKIKKTDTIFWAARHEEPHKGLKNLNQIWKISKYPNNFKVGGVGPDTKILKMKNSLIGIIPKDKMGDLMRSAGVFILTSNYEGLPLMVSESLSQGTPVVMFDSFTSAKVFKDCEAVKLIKHKDYIAFDKAIDELLSLDKKEYDRVAMAGIDFVENNTSYNNFKRDWIKVIKMVSGIKDE